MNKLVIVIQLDISKITLIMLTGNLNDTGRAQDIRYRIIRLIFYGNISMESLQAWFSYQMGYYYMKYD